MDSDILEKHGLTPIEWDALFGPRKGYFLSLDEAALTAVRFLEANNFSDEEVPTADSFREALQGLIKRGWLTVYTEPSEVRAARLSARGILFPPLEPQTDEGTIDLTPYGYRQYQKILDDLQGSREPQTVTWVDEKAQTFTCISETKRACQSWINDEILEPVRGGIEQWFYSPVRIASIKGPERIGPWKSCEADRTHPHGWRIVITVKRVRRRRFSLPDWQAEGWITPLEEVRIEGKIQGIRFHFSESAERGYGTPVYHTYLTICDGKSRPTKRIYTTLNGVKTLAYVAGRYRDTHFRWEETRPRPPTRTKPFTIPEALVCLQEGFSAWKSARANKLGA